MQTDINGFDVKDIAPTQCTVDGNGIDGSINGKDQSLQEVDWTPKEERNAKRKYVLIEDNLLLERYLTIHPGWISS